MLAGEILTIEIADVDAPEREIVCGLPEALSVMLKMAENEATVRG
jgi:hypothetical protein